MALMFALIPFQNCSFPGAVAMMRKTDSVPAKSLSSAVTPQPLDSSQDQHKVDQ